MTIYFDSFRKTVNPGDPKARWAVSYHREHDGWEVRLREKTRKGWSQEVIFFLVGNDIHAHDALRAYDQHRSKL